MFSGYAGMETRTNKTMEIDPPTTPPSSKSNNCEQIVSPGGTKYWEPTCDTSIKPHVGQKFIDFAAAGQFYDEYTATTRFDTRLGTSKKHGNRSK